MEVKDIVKTGKISILFLMYVSCRRHLKQGSQPELTDMVRYTKSESICLRKLLIQLTGIIHKALKKNYITSRNSLDQTFLQSTQLAESQFTRHTL